MLCRLASFVRVGTPRKDGRARIVDIETGWKDQVCVGAWSFLPPNEKGRIKRKRKQEQTRIEVRATDTTKNHNFRRSHRVRRGDVLDFPLVYAPTRDPTSESVLVYVWLTLYRQWRSSPPACFVAWLDGFLNHTIRLSTSVPMSDCDSAKLPQVPRK